MTPIINPIFFYWIEVADAIKVVCLITAILAGIIAIIMFLTASDYVFDKKDENDRAYLRRRRVFVIISVITLIIAMLTPSRDTMYKMAAASFVTEDNIEYVVEKGKDGIEYIVEVIEDAFNGEDKEED
jgi:putative flippase GtrA